MRLSTATNDALPVLRIKTDRRDPVSRARIVRQVRNVFARSPGRRVTIAESAVLLHVREDICGRVLNTLVDDGILARSVPGAYELRRR